MRYSALEARYPGVCAARDHASQSRRIELRVELSRPAMAGAGPSYARALAAETVDSGMSEEQKLRAALHDAPVRLAS